MLCVIKCVDKKSTFNIGKRFKIGYYQRCKGELKIIIDIYFIMFKIENIY